MYYYLCVHMIDVVCAILYNKTYRNHKLHHRHHRIDAHNTRISHHIIHVLYYAYYNWLLYDIHVIRLMFWAFEKRPYIPPTDWDGGLYARVHNY